MFSSSVREAQQSGSSVASLETDGAHVRVGEQFAPVRS